ncbi:uncharacterized protein LOC112841715 [Oreochromis niloticus]|uniref:uncharacterized protein LOC112841715 n=1 Tax=Oreochromis niloticus TaxID=8128 RepID=UPI000DF39F62|nr:uncharacterized protein LOC112841715 [Oreochromis niloticus]
MSVLEGNIAEFPGSSSVSMNSDEFGDYHPVFSHELGPSGKKRQQHKHRAEFPGSSSVSMNSDMSRDHPPVFSHEPGPSGTQRQQHKHRAEFPGSSSMSMNSDMSRDHPPVFSHEHGTQRQQHKHRAEFPGSSSVSMNSDMSRDHPPVFSHEPGPSGTQRQQHKHRAEFPGSSSMSMNSDMSRDHPPVFSHEHGTQRQQHKHQAEFPGSSSVSMNSDMSRDHPPVFSHEPGPSGTQRQQHKHRAEFPGSSSMSMNSDMSRDHPPVFSHEHGTQEKKRNFFVGEPVSCCVLHQDVLKDSSTDFCPQCGVKSGTRTYQQTAYTDLEKCLDALKVTLRTRYERVMEGTDKTGIGALLRLIYTELYITEEQSEAVHFQHEVRQVESACKKTLRETPISCKDIFKTFPDQQRPIRVVLTYGVAGIGKTFLVQKFTLDWAEGLENQHISAVVLLSFRELNLVRDEQYSLLELIHVFHPTLQSITAEKLTIKKKKKYHKGQEMNQQEFTNLEQCGLDVTEASVYSGVCTEILKRESVIFQKPVYCFVHLSVQEFLAAVYMFHCYTNRKTEELKEFFTEDDEGNKISLKDISSLEDFLCRAMDESLKIPNSHLELFVRFLHGLSMKSNQRLVGGLLGQTESSPEIIQRVINNLKKISRKGKCPERCINILYCLREINDVLVHQEVQEFQKSQNKSEKKLSEIECTALAHMLMMSENVMEEFDLQKYNTTYGGRWSLLPAVVNCRKARLYDVYIFGGSCGSLALALTSDPSHLRELHMKSVRLEEHAEELFTHLGHPNCRLETLSFEDSTLSEKNCSELLTALKSNPPYLKRLDLIRCTLEGSGMKQLYDYLESPHCKLQFKRVSVV